jgi:hypothetical protein
MTFSEEQEMALAASLDTPTEILEELSLIERASLTSCLAQNPSVPLPTLYRLWHQHPQQIFVNPILPLLLLEDPNFFIREDHRSLLQEILKVKSLPESFMGLASKSTDAWALHLLASREDLPVWLMEELAYKGVEPSYDALARNPNLPESLVMYLLEETRLSTRLVLVERPGLSSALWEMAANNAYPQVRAKVAEAANSYLLARLSKDPDSSVREVVAKHNQLTPEIAERLAQDTVRQIREAIASNSSTPEEILLSLAVDRDVRVRAIVAERPSLSDSLFALLGADPERAILRIITSRIDLPDALRQKLGDARVHELQEEMQRRSARISQIRARYQARCTEIEDAGLCGFASSIALTKAEDEYKKSLEELDDAP